MSVFVHCEHCDAMTLASEKGPDLCVVCVQVANGRADERAAIVAYLRQQGAEGAAVVGAIERGVHLGSSFIAEHKSINEPPGIAAEPPGICERPPGNGAECPRCELSEDDHKYAANPNIIAPGSTPSIECGVCGGCWGHAHSVRDDATTWWECTHGCGWRSPGTKVDE